MQPPFLPVPSWVFDEARPVEEMIFITDELPRYGKPPLLLVLRLEHYEAIAADLARTVN